MSEVSSSDWSETDNSNTAATPNGWPEGQNPGSVNNCARAMMGALKRFWGRINGEYASTGSANAYVLTPSVALGAYATGERYSFRANFSNTDAATLNISSLGAKDIKKYGTSGKAALESGDIQSGASITVEYDGTDMILVTPVASAQLGTIASRSDYAEGSWTPVLAGSSTAGTQTYSVQTGRYIRAGNLVWISGRITLTAKDATTAGNMTITGLPFAASSITGMHASLSVSRWGNVTLSSGAVLTAEVEQGTSKINLLTNGTGVANSSLGAAGIAATTDLGFAGVYRIN